MLILASTSRTRQMLLSNAGLAFRSISPDVDEQSLLDANLHWTPAEASRSLAAAKASSVSRIEAHAITIGGDQILALDGHIYQKPRDREECRLQLQMLRGKTHQLVSTVVSAHRGTVIWTYCQEASMTMRVVSDAFIDDYLDRIGDACTASVGGYQLETLGVQLFEKVEGDYFCILGLPMVPLLNHLRFVKAIPS